MTLTSGTRFGAYEVLDHVGSGGMGDVYRARDTTLGRIVALKLVRTSSGASDESVDRVGREAQVLASLHHPSIAAIFALEEINGVRAIIQEFVDGPTLDQRLRPGPLPLAETIAMARQIADALDIAHSRGIVHRDLKPANIKLTDEGRVKLLDFGLAKMFESGAEHVSTLETMSATTARTILGTPSYMSPEQAAGAPVDRRADIWAFGCIVFEMLTGHRPFDGPTVASTISATLHGDPDWSTLPTTTPAGLRRMLERCLQKDARRRQRDIGDIDWEAIVDPPRVGETPSRSWGWQHLVAAGVVGLAGGALAIGLSSWVSSRSNALKPPIVASLTLDNFGSRASRGNGGSLALSPDGALVVYAARRDPSARLWVRRLDRAEAAPIPGTEDSFAPFFSPDGRWIAFFTTTELRKVALAGGAPQVVTALTGDTRGGAWLDDDTIVIGGDQVVRVPASGGSPTVIAAPDPASAVDYRWPTALPNGRGVLAVKVTARTNFEVVAILFDGSGPISVMGAATNPRLVPGYLVFAPQLSVDAGTRFRSLSAVAFDERSLRASGSPFPVLDSLLIRQGGVAEVDVSRDGTMIAMPPVDPRSTLSWVDREGRIQPLAANREPADFFSPRVSRDGMHVLVTVQGVRPGVYVLNAVDGTQDQRIRIDDGEDHYPVWSPEGGRIASSSDGLGQVTWRSVQSGQVEGRIDTNRHLHTQDWSPDGRFILADAQYEDWDIVAVDTSTREVTIIVGLPGDQQHARVSPDGKWLAFTSTQSGRNEVMVTAFKPRAVPVRVSPDGGNAAEWSVDGRELFYRRGPTVLAVSVNAAGPDHVTTSTPRELFSGEFQPGLAPSKGRFLMLSSSRDRTAETESMQLTVNWLDDIRRRASGLAGARGER